MKYFVIALMILIVNFKASADYDSFFYDSESKVIRMVDTNEGCSIEFDAGGEPTDTLLDQANQVLYVFTVHHGLGGRLQLFNLKTEQVMAEKAVPMRDGKLQIDSKSQSVMIDQAVVCDWIIMPSIEVLDIICNKSGDDI